MSDFFCKRLLNGLTYLLFGVVLLVLSPDDAHSQKVDTTKKGLENISYYLLYRNHDTSYIKNYSHKISAKLVTINKYNYFKIRDRINKTSIGYIPVRDVSLGY